MKAFKTRIHPTTEQAILIDKTIGCCRFVYNGLNAKITQYEKDKTNISTYDLIKQQSLIDLQSAYTKFFREHKGLPNYHKKGIKDSYRSLNTKCNIRHSIKISKIGEIKAAKERNIQRE